MSEPNPTPHRRPQRYQRGAVRLPVRISTIDAETDPETGDPFFLSADEQSANLSRGGIFVVTGERVPTGSRLLVELEIPGGPAVEAIGRVAWRRAPQVDSEARPGIGIEFLGGSHEDFSAVEHYVERVARRTRRPEATPLSSSSTTV